MSFCQSFLCMHSMYLHMCVCMGVWRSETGVWCLTLLLSTSFLVDIERSFSELSAHWLARLVSQGLWICLSLWTPLFLSPELGLQTWAIVPRVLVGKTPWDPKSGLHTCRAGNLSSSCPPNSCFVIWLAFSFSFTYLILKNLSILANFLFRMYSWL